MRNNNQTAIRRISSKSLKNNRVRNLFAISAIVLTCMLFTAVFSMFDGMIQAAQEATMHEVGGRFHAGLKDVTREQYEKIISDPMVKKSSYSIFIGVAENIIKRQTEIRYLSSEDDLPDWFITLEEGKMPEKENEILVDTFAMDALKIPHKIGEKITLIFSFLGKEIEKEFTISGYYEGDSISHASELFISEDFWITLKGDLTDADFKAWAEKHPDDIGVGTIAGNLFFDNASNIEKKVKTVIGNAGYEPGDGEGEIDYGINWAYMSNRMESTDPFSVLLVIGALLVILLTGYLIIYNIFQISVISDIRFYGLLKTIGTTKKQLQSFIMRQVILLSMVGIPIGLLLGYLIGRAGVPIAIRMFSYGDMKFSLKFEPMIFIFGALFSIVTVFLSCRKPGKIAGMVSPIEAVKFTEGMEITKNQKGKRQKRIEKNAKKAMKKRRKRRDFSLLSMAFANLGRNKKKTSVVILAISLSVILLTLIMTGVGSFRIERFLEQRIAGDIMLESATLSNVAASGGGYELDKEYVELARAQKGIEQENEMWVSFSKSVRLDEVGKKRYQELDKEGKLRHDEYEDIRIKDVLSDGLMSGNVYGYTDELLKNVKVLEGKLDIDKFQQGDYILLAEFLGAEDQVSFKDSLYHPGEKVMISSVTDNSKEHEVKDESGETIDVTYEDREEKEYEVMAIIELPYSMDLHRYSFNAMSVVLPKKELTNENNGLESCCFVRSFQIEEESLDAFEAAIKDYTENKNMYMSYTSKRSLEEQFMGMVNTVGIIGIVLAAVIAFIGILNFINAVFTGIISRKREFAMLQSIGMTARQLQIMMICEGVSYVAIAGMISFCLGSLFAYLVLSALNNVIVYFEYRFQIQPFLIMFPILTIVAVITPMISFRLLQKHSVVERLREAE